MGTLIGLILVTGLQVASAAAAPLSLMLYLPDGNPRHLSPAEVVVVTHRNGVPTDEHPPTLALSSGELLSEARRIGPGRWSYGIRLTQTTSVNVRASADGTAIQRTIGPPATPISRVAGPSKVVGEVGAPVTFMLRDTRSPAATAEEVQVYVDEGTAELVDGEDGALALRWAPGSAPYPRAVPIGIHDLRTPSLPPAWTVVHLHGRPRIPIRTEPGVQVKLQIGGRDFGPWTADDQGNIETRPEVRPGESTAKVLASDSLGNHEESTIALGGDVRPRLGVVNSGSLVPGRSLPTLWIHAIAPDGTPWTGQDPACATTTGETIPLMKEAENTWRAQPNIGAATVDVRVRCAIGAKATVTTVIPVVTDLPTRLVLRVYPDRLSADLPVAEVQAFLENAAGDRLPSRGIQIEAEHGDIELDAGGLGRDIRGVYQGARATGVGGDTLVAGANLPPGEGGVWSLDVLGAAPGGKDRVLIDGRARDRFGRPLGDIPLTVRAAGRSAEVRTNSRGWASVEMPWPAMEDVAVVEVTAAGIVRRTAILPDDKVEAGPGAADLETEVSVSIVPGRIRNMILTAEPRILESGGDRGRIRVRLEDGAGNAIADDGVQITATVGLVGEPETQKDGTFEATYTPPTGMPATTARITATSPDERYSASTDIQIVPRRFRNATGVHFGALLGFQGITSPVGAIEHDFRLPLPPFIVRGSIGYYQAQAETFDAVAGTPVRMNLRMLPISVGLLARKDATVLPTWVGAELVMAPHRVEAWLGDERVATGTDVTAPGFRVLSGLGWRLRSGEFQAQFGYLVLYGTRTTVGWNGPLGGVVGTLGYKVLY